jgi:hypothetical protein
MVMISTVIQIDTYNQRKCSFPPHPLIQSPKRGKLIIGLYMKLTGRHSRPLPYLPSPAVAGAQRRHNPADSHEGDGWVFLTECSQCGDPALPLTGSGGLEAGFMASGRRPRTSTDAASRRTRRPSSSRSRRHVHRLGFQ